MADRKQMEDLKLPVEHLHKLLADPHPGLTTWLGMYQERLREVVEIGLRLLPVTATSVFLVNTHRYGFKAGEALLILDVEMVTLSGQKQRPCYRVLALDGQEDSGVISDTEHFKLISFQDLEEKRIPAIDH
jgi:hypothetical protein